MSKSNPKLRLPLYAILAATLLVMGFVWFVLQLNEPTMHWAEAFIVRFLR